MMLGEKEDNDFQRNGKVILGKISVNEISRDDKHAATLFSVGWLIALSMESQLVQKEVNWMGRAAASAEPSIMTHGQFTGSQFTCL